MPRPGFLILPGCRLLSHTAPAAHATTDEPADLSQAREVYARKFEFATQPIRDRYLSNLEPR